MNAISRELARTMHLRCALSEKRHRELEGEMAQTKTEIDRLAAELECARDTCRSKVKDLEQRLKIAATISHQGFEMVPVPVIKTFNPDAKTVTLKRLDTNQVSTKPMEKLDEQEWLKHVSKQKRAQALPDASSVLPTSAGQ